MSGGRGQAGEEEQCGFSGTACMVCSGPSRKAVWPK